ncbi:tetratricopeptide repeat protein [Shouchella shacheensis]|uniref:tetratricopeptide repeat protein n=1 Tax=Shouchella shacheensis TaxID=1649580 RepID=UPI00073FFAA3|nr:tetratricopeptide repeat protein [Shouchella shacheensis]
MNLQERVLEAIERGDVEAGLEILDQAMDTSDHEQKYQVAELFYELGHVEKAEKLVEELMVLYPDEGSLYVLAAEMKIDADKEDEAIELLSDIHEDDDAFLQAQLLLADLYQLQALDEVAEQKLLFAREKAPEEIILTYALGEFYLEQGAYNKAIPYLKQAHYTKEDVGGVNVGLKLAEAYSANGQFEDALSLYQQSAKDEFTPTTMFNFGFTAYQHGDYTVAIEQLEGVKTLDADFTSVYLPLARAYEAENRLDEALEVLRDGMGMDEFNDSLYLLAGKLSLKKQDLDQAEGYLRQAVALNPSNMEALQTLSAYLRAQERSEDLLDLLEHTSSYGETDAMLTWYEAFARADQEEYHQAAQLYEEAYATFYEDTDFLSEYGQFLLEEGKRTRAVDLLQKARALDPGRADVTELLESLAEDR